MEERTLERRSARTTKRPPRARGQLPLIGSSIDVLRGLLEFLERVSREHGDVVEFEVPSLRVYLFNHPDAIEQVLVTERDRLVKDKLTRDLAPLLGNGLLVSEGAFWRKQRRLAQPGFHRDRVAAYGDVMVRYAERAIADWRDGETRDVHKEMSRLTLGIVGKTLFGVEIGDLARRFERSFESIMKRYSGVGYLVPMSVPTLTNLRAKSAIEELDAIVYGIIRERRAGGDNGDLISMLIAATSDEDGAMDDRQLRDEAITLVLAGHETTALTLAYALYLLARHPAVAERLVREIDEVLGDGPATAADMPRLPYADGVIRESMRLYPPGYALGREASAPCTIGGYPIEPGTQLWVAPWVVHRDPRWFPDPLAFRPERWDNDFAKSLPRQAYFPFGSGPRVCIGKAFATMEAVLVLVTIARRFRFSSASEKPLALTPSVTLRPTHGIPLGCSVRRPSTRVSS